MNTQWLSTANFNSFIEWGALQIDDPSLNRYAELTSEL